MPFEASGALCATGTVHRAEIINPKMVEINLRPLAWKKTK